MIDFNVLLKGAKCVNVFLQPTSCTIFSTDTFVINFKKENCFISFHSFAFIRLIKDDVVLYTDVDHYLNTTGTSWRNGQKKLSTATFPKLKNLLIDNKVLNFQIKACGDIILTFGNNNILEFLVDYTRRDGDEINRLIIERDGDIKTRNHYIFGKGRVISRN